MLTEEQKKKNGCDIKENDEYGYVADDLSKILTLEGKTKMCSYYRDLNSDRIHSQLCPTYGPNDRIPVSEMTIQPYMDENHGEYYVVIWNEMNDSPLFGQMMEKLGISNYEDCVIDFSDPKVNEVITEVLKNRGRSPNDILDERVEVQINPLTMVYNTSLSSEANEKLLLKYFELVESQETAAINHVEGFISYHKQDLIECFKGKENLTEFIKSKCGLEPEIVDKLTEEVNSYSPEEIMNGINVRQGELDEIMAETAREAHTPELNPNDKRQEEPGEQEN